VSRYLRTISYRQGYVEFIRLPQFDTVEVTVDPRINSGSHTIARRGVRVADVVSRIAAGEPDDQVAMDYGLSTEEVQSLFGSRS
jgi:uncharacterized protein (DUF433 family)